MADSKEYTLALLSTTTVSFAANAVTELYVVPEGHRCVPFAVHIVAGADASTTDVQVGQSTATNDFLAVTDLGLINAQYDGAWLIPIPAANVLLGKSYAAGTSIVMEVTNQAGGATNTVRLFGFIY